MFNLMTAESYRLRHKRALHLVMSISVILIVLAAIVIAYFGHTDKSFPYFRMDFYFMSAVGINIATVLVIYFFGVSLLTTTDYQMISHAIAFGQSRENIFMSKLAISLFYFVLFCIVSMIEMFFVSAIIFPDFDETWLVTLKAIFNIMPIFLAIFCVSFSLAILRINYLITIIVLMFLFLLSEKLTYMLSKTSEIFEFIHQYTPGQLYLNNLAGYYNRDLTIDFSYWLVGGICVCLFLIVSFIKFKKKEF
ncbi:hypothetical protein [Staphylococcus felis]|uniref:Uncharacterized protein n=1 Tax=Staphylococcus felis TaxID=46127 RepID=A0A3E0IMP8_9STAP|nr:hypothetical protein [Staphylococcus felis]REH87672.1 hypothetical protein DOS61_00255 [Staphylococcus felis]REH88534.1 hypothetical protein DOS58_08595 [Staphylococcus felis]REH92606.1 hypothetical protein DOS83_10175 [Staphylococcus felis]